MDDPKFKKGNRIVYMKSDNGTVIRKTTSFEHRHIYVIRFDDGIITDCDEAYLTPGDTNGTP